MRVQKRIFRAYSHDYSQKPINSSMFPNIYKIKKQQTIKVVIIFQQIKKKLSLSKSNFIWSNNFLYGRKKYKL